MSISSRIAQNVSVCEAGSTPFDVEVPVVLAAHVVGRVGLGHGDEHVALAVADRVGGPAGRRLHRDHAQHLQEVVLDDVAHRSDRLVEVPAIGDVEGLGHRDLHGGDELPVPDRLEHRVGEAQVEDVLDRHLPQEVVDPVQLRLVDERVQLGVERPGRLEIVPERLLDDDAGSLGQTGAGQPLDDGAEQERRDLEVEDR